MKYMVLALILVSTQALEASSTAEARASAVYSVKISYRSRAAEITAQARQELSGRTPETVADLNLLSSDLKNTIIGFTRKIERALEQALERDTDTVIEVTDVHRRALFPDQATICFWAQHITAASQSTTMSTRQHTKAWQAVPAATPTLCAQPVTIR